MEKYDPNAPAFGPLAPKLEPEAEATTEPAVVVPVKEEEAEPLEESKVPYSRFKKFHDRALEAEREAEEWRRKATDIQETRRESAVSDVPEYWRKLYGDSDASKEAWLVQKQANDELRAEARRDAIEALRSERTEEITRTNENVATLDENFEDLSAFVGRDLTEKEQSAILDIVDDYTPKDGDGNYAGALLPFDKAWEIYELKNQTAKAPKTQARNAIAGLTAQQTEGDTSITTERDKSFNPLDWNAWKNRV